MYIEHLENTMHDIVTPMTVIGSMIKCVMAEFVTNENLSYYLNMTQKQIDMLFDIIKNGSVAGKIINENYVVCLTMEDIYDLVEEQTNAFKYTMGRKNISLTLVSEIETKLMPLDKHLITRIINNLLSNAEKFTPSYGEVVVNIKTDSNTASIKVSDNGEGFSAEMLEHGIKRYYTKKNEINRNGSGMGLDIVQRIVGILGGEVKIGNGKNGGAEIGFTIPIITNEDLPIELK